MATRSSGVLAPEDLREVFEALIDAQHEWDNIGLRLRVPQGKLDIIKEENENFKNRLRETLSYWLKNADSPTWDDLRNALRSQSVGHELLAKNLLQPHQSTLESTGKAAGNTCFNRFTPFSMQL